MGFGKISIFDGLIKLHDIVLSVGLAVRISDAQQVVEAPHVTRQLRKVTNSALQTGCIDDGVLKFKVIAYAFGLVVEIRKPYGVLGQLFQSAPGILQDMARTERFPVPLAAAALQMYLATSGAGMGQNDDSSVARIYATLSGASLPGDK
jgi:putative dehydrogenase